MTHAVSKPLLAARRRTLWIAALGTLLVLAVFSAFVVSVAGSARALHAGVGGETWALSGMSLGLAAALLPSGALADDLGHGRVLRWSAALLAVASAAAALAPDIVALVAARVVQGLAGGATLAAGLGAIGHAFPAGPARTSATGVWGAAVGAGIAAGPLAGAALSTALGWRAPFWAEAGVALALMVAARAIADTPPAARRPLDVAGVSTLGVAMALLVAGLVELRHPHAGSEAIALLAAAVLVLAGFAVVERTRRQPMLDPRLLTRAPFLASVLGALFTGLAVVGLMSYCPAFTERALGLSALGSAAVLAAWSVTSTAVALAARSLPARLAPRTRLATGLALAAAGEAGLSGLGVGASWAQLVPGLVLAGVGTGLANAALGRVAVDSVPRGQAGMGSGANNTARYLGAAAGAAVVLTIAAGRDTAELVHGWNAAALVTAALGALGALIVAACRPKVQGPVSGAMPDAPRAGRPEHDRATESVH